MEKEIVVGWQDVAERLDAERLELVARIAVLEGALTDAIGAIEHAAHPVASQWLPSLRKKLHPPPSGREQA